MTVKAPDTDGWMLIRKSDLDITFGKGKPGDTFMASVSMFRLRPAATPEEFERLIREGAARDVDPNYPDRYEVLEQSTAYSAERRYPCVRYRGLFKDHRAKGSTAPEFLALDGLYCRHPIDATAGTAIIYSHRGRTQYTGLREEAERFIQGVQLPEEIDAQPPR
jgi:hypothetical protein